MGAAFALPGVLAHEQGGANLYSVWVLHLLCLACWLMSRGAQIYIACSVGRWRCGTPRAAPAARRSCAPNLAGAAATQAAALPAPSGPGSRTAAAGPRGGRCCCNTAVPQCLLTLWSSPTRACMQSSLPNACVLDMTPMYALLHAYFPPGLARWTPRAWNILEVCKAGPAALRARMASQREEASPACMMAQRRAGG